MNNMTGAAKRLIFSLLVAGSLGGCAVYAPYPYEQSGYYGPAPVSLDLGFYGYGHGRGHDRGGHHGWR